MESCGMNCIKYVLIIFNGLFMIFGIVIISAAAVDMGVIREYTGNPQVNGTETDGVLIAVGVLIILIAGFGCFGAIKENVKLLYMYVACLIVIILLELSVGIAAAAMRPQLVSEMKNQLRSSFISNKNAKDAGDSINKDFWNKVQKNMECCGVQGPEDYSGNSAPANFEDLPNACCPNTFDINDEVEAEKHRRTCVINNLFFRDGCEDKILNSVRGSGSTVAIVGILFCFLEVAGIVFALWLAHSIKNEGKPVGTA